MDSREPDANDMTATDILPSTDSTAISEACGAVMYTAELLEAILDFLPPKKVLLSKRVCRQFRDLVDSSVTLQKKLWYRVSSRTEDQDVWVVNGGPLLQDGHLERLTGRDSDPKLSLERNVVLATFNPMLLRRYYYEENERLSDVARRTIEPMPWQFPELLLRGLRDGPKQTWENMLLIETPVLSAAVDARWSISFHITIETDGRKVEFPMYAYGDRSETGMTVRALLNAIRNSPARQHFEPWICRNIEGQSKWDSLFEPEKLEKETLRDFIEDLETNLGGTMEIDTSEGRDVHMRFWGVIFTTEEKLELERKDNASR
ncbi:hypothetical protein MYCFIDRAFT_171083 [Lecanosticta acicola]|uniref:F-box domain-containing protein n=1 Tax=Lecanosticta acicola TaxID=111012 RepID=A0AAI8YVJ6_9PEZI|nr:hypothetical protein MYCFIDRAFT_171083 [Lecanosticta acicola]